MAPPRSLLRRPGERPPPQAHAHPQGRRQGFREDERVVARVPEAEPGARGVPAGESQAGLTAASAAIEGEMSGEGSDQGVLGAQDAPEDQDLGGDPDPVLFLVVVGRRPGMRASDSG